ncbi:MAG TPA: ABC transporter permease [Arthrobacter sp.]|nr:ABC transporter permease [Arthrobacter sp.]
MPAVVFIFAAAGTVLVLLPLIAMALRVDWAGFWPLVTSDGARAALGLSLRTATASTLVCLLLGTPLALVLARSSFPGRRLLRALVLLPLVLPPVVGGMALLYTFGRQGLLGSTLELWGIQIAFSTTAVVLAQSFVALPFLVLSVEASLRSAGGRYEQAAATLGARPATVLRRVTLPLLLPALASGTVLCFARALGEFGATLTFAGSLTGVTRTLPLEIYLQRETDPDAAVALSMLLVAAAVVIVALTYGRTGLGMGRRAGTGAGTGPGAQAGTSKGTGNGVRR